MSKVLIIGAGGVGTVVAHKVAQHPEVFTEVNWWLYSTGLNPKSLLTWHFHIRT